MLKMAVGHSVDVDSADAIEEVLARCQETLGDADPQAGILFAAIDHDFQEILAGIYNTFPDIELIGCTTDGELSSESGFAEDSLTLALLSSDSVAMRAAVAYDVAENPLASIEKALKGINAPPPDEPQLCITTPVSISTSANPIIRAFRATLGEQFPIFGGTAADQWRFETDYQFCMDEVLTSAVPFLLMYGPLHYSFGIASGWEPIGKRGRVTEVAPGMVLKIDDRNALELYTHYLGDNLDTLGEFPLAVFDAEDQESFYLRAVVRPDLERGELLLGGDVPLDSWVQMTQTTRDHVIDATKLAVDQALQTYPGSTPSAAFCFSCAGRKLVLGTRTEEECHYIQKIAPGLPTIGFYGYGEIAPLQRGEMTYFHNETFVTLLIGTE